VRLAGSASWQIHIERWAEVFDLPLWIRAAERIHSAGALIPGPLEIDPLPEPTTVPNAEMAEGWVDWWHAVVSVPRPDPLAGVLAGPDLSFAPPDFAGLDRWPGLREVVARRWLEAHERHTARKGAAIRAQGPPRAVEPRVVREAERSLRRPVKPFVLELVVLPVRDEEVRRVHENRYLVPERVYDGPGWAGQLAPLVTRLGA
jgi:hypothetical protein